MDTLETTEFNDPVWASSTQSAAVIPNATSPPVPVHSSTGRPSHNQLEPATNQVSCL